MKIREVAQKAENLIEQGEEAKQRQIHYQQATNSARTQLMSAYAHLEAAASETDVNGNPTGDVSGAMAEVYAAQVFLESAEAGLAEATQLLESIGYQKMETVHEIEQYEAVEEGNLSKLQELQKKRFGANANTFVADLVARMNSGEQARQQLLISMGIATAGKSYSAGGVLGVQLQSLGGNGYVSSEELDELGGEGSFDQLLDMRKKKDIDPRQLWSFEDGSYGFVKGNNLENEVTISNTGDMFSVVIAGNESKYPTIKKDINDVYRDAVKNGDMETTNALKTTFANSSSVSGSVQTNRTGQLSDHEWSYDEKATWVQSVVPGIDKSDAECIVSAMEFYSGFGHVDIHWDEQAQLVTTQNILRVFDSKCVGTYEGTIHRGISFDSKHDLKKALVRGCRDSWKEPGITSFSADKSIAEDFASRKEWGLVLSCNNNKSAIPFRHMSKTSWEDEVLSPGGLRNKGWTIDNKSIVVDPDKHIVYADIYEN